MAAITSTSRIGSRVADTPIDRSIITAARSHFLFVFLLLVAFWFLLLSLLLLLLLLLRLHLTFPSLLLPLLLR